MRRLSWASLAALSLVGGAPVLAGPEATALSAVNAARAEAGCKPLRVDPKLRAAAVGHARAMAEQNFFSHTGKDGRGLVARVRAQGYSYWIVAENIAAGQKTAREVVATWLKSPGHRRNILNCTLSETGIALVYQPEDRPIRGNPAPFRYYWVQVFATPR